MAKGNADSRGRQVRFRVETSPERACGVYSNASIVSTHESESRIDFLYVDHAATKEGEVPARLVSRVIMPTTVLASLSESLSNHIAKHLERDL